MSQPPGGLSGAGLGAAVPAVRGGAPRPTALGVAAAVWGVLGFAALLLGALGRLTPIALEPVRAGDLGLGGALLYAACIALNAWAEGYRAFQRRYAPMLAARAFCLARTPRLLPGLLAPLFCMGLAWATRRRLIVGWCTAAGIVLLVVGVKQLPQPWRGAIDAGVVVGLAWGLLTTLVQAFLALGAGRAPSADPFLDARTARAMGRAER